MKLYGVTKVPGEDRDIEQLMKEIYLDFYSNSLQPENDKGKWAYSKRLQEEAKEHQKLLTSIL